MSLWSLAADNPATPVPLSEKCLLCVRWQFQEERWASRVPLRVSPPAPLLYTNMSRTDWEMHLQDLNAVGTWMEEEEIRHIGVLEITSVQLALNAFHLRIMGESVVLMNDNATVVVYVK